LTPIGNNSDVLQCIPDVIALRDGRRPMQQIIAGNVLGRMTQKYPAGLACRQYANTAVSL